MARKKNEKQANESVDVSRFDIAPEALKGKTASEAEVIRWVARNIDNPDCSADDCPDPFAWSLLRNCHEDSTFRRYFIGTMWTKLLGKGGESNDSSGDIDGSVQIAMIEKIQGLRSSNGG